MPEDLQPLIQQIHNSPTQIAVALSGGGSRILSELLEVPGASRTLLEAVVPYCETAMIAWLGGRPDQFCSQQTARAMAMAAFHRARQLDEDCDQLAGIGCTASLASDRPKRGDHRIHVAMQTLRCTAAWSVTLEKGRRSRSEEEGVAARMVLGAVAHASGTQTPPLDLCDSEPVETSDVTAPNSWQDLLLGRVDVVRHGETAAAVFPGAFNPIHVGHRGMIEVAREIAGGPIACEISIENVDKPPLDYWEIDRRLGQFDAEQPVWLSRAATFVEKSRLFPGATFLVGTDTMRRIVDPRYYGNDKAACQAAIDRIAQRGCRFLVFGRNPGTGLVRCGDLDLPESLRAICKEIPPEQFREDVSSTSLRRAGQW